MRFLITLILIVTYFQSLGQIELNLSNTKNIYLYDEQKQKYADRNIFLEDKQYSISSTLYLKDEYSVKTREFATEGYIRTTKITNDSSKVYINIDKNDKKIYSIQYSIEKNSGVILYETYNDNGQIVNTKHKSLNDTLINLIKKDLKLRGYYNLIKIMSDNFTEKEYIGNKIYIIAKIKNLNIFDITGDTKSYYKQVPGYYYKLNQDNNHVYKCTKDGTITEINKLPIKVVETKNIEKDENKSPKTDQAVVKKKTNESYSAQKPISEPINKTGMGKTLFNSADDVYAFLYGTWVGQGTSSTSAGTKINIRNYYFDCGGISGSITVKSFKNDTQLKQGYSVVKICPSGYSCDEFTVTGIGRMMYMGEIFIKQ